MAGIPQIKIIFDRRKKASAVTTGTVEVEVSYNRERLLIMALYHKTVEMPSIK